MSNTTESLQKLKDQFQSGEGWIQAPNKGFGDSGALIIAEMLRKNPKTNTLSLYNNDISDEGFIAILEAMEDNTNLEWLNVGNNNITDVGGLAFAEFLKTNHPSLKAVGLSDSNLTDESAFSIAEALESNVTLEKFVLEGNEITEEGKTALKRFGDFFNGGFGTVIHS